jgi:dienelactone hydrolase
MFKPGFLLAKMGLLFCCLSDVAFAQNGPGPSPLVVVPVANGVLASGTNHDIWFLPIDGSDAWRRVPLSKTAALDNVVCAGDASGVCIISYHDVNGPHTDIYQTQTGALGPFPISAPYISAFPTRDHLYYLALGEDQKNWDLMSYSFADLSAHLVGTVKPDEGLSFVPVDGQLTALAFKDDIARQVAVSPAFPPLKLGRSDGEIFTKDSLLLPESWMVQTEEVPGQRAILTAQLHKVQAPEGAKVVLSPGEHAIVAMPVNGESIFNPNNVAMNVNEDIVAELSGPRARGLGVLCRKADGLTGFKSIANFAPFETVQIIGQAMGQGFIIVQYDLGHSAKFAYLSLKGTPGYKSRTCADTQATLTDLDIPQTNNADKIDITISHVTRPDGTQIPYLIAAPKGVPVEHVLIDVYGAYGKSRDFPYITGSIPPDLEQTHTALVYPIVRGDGDLGYAYGVASAAPNRGKAVEDVTAVARAVSASFPGLKAKPTVRGSSAGGWLAMAAALAHPDLFSGAIGYSGMYELSGSPQTTASFRFFEDVDDLGQRSEAIKAGCPHLRFRFLHARNDNITPYTQAVAFADKLKAPGCPVDFETFDTGGHGIDITFDHADDAKRREHAYFDPF